MPKIAASCGTQVLRATANKVRLAGHAPELLVLANPSRGQVGGRHNRADGSEHVDLGVQAVYASNRTTAVENLPQRRKVGDASGDIAQVESSYKPDRVAGGDRAEEPVEGGLLDEGADDRDRAVRGMCAIEKFSLPAMIYQSHSATLTHSARASYG